MNAKIKTEDFTRGFDRGNYGNVYETEDWDTFYCRQPLGDSEDYHEGLLLGFFSSYELEEIVDNAAAEMVHTLRAKWGES